MLIEDNHQSENKNSVQSELEILAEEDEKIPEKIPETGDISKEITEIEIPYKIPVEEVSEIQREIPDIQLEIPEFEKEVPGVQLEIPEVEKETPEVEKEIPELATEIPEVESEGESNKFELVEKEATTEENIKDFEVEISESGITEFVEVKMPRVPPGVVKNSSEKAEKSEFIKKFIKKIRQKNCQKTVKKGPYHLENR